MATASVRSCDRPAADPARPWSRAAAGRQQYLRHSRVTNIHRAPPKNIPVPEEIQKWLPKLVAGKELGGGGESLSQLSAQKWKLNVFQTDSSPLPK